MNFTSNSYQSITDRINSVIDAVVIFLPKSYRRTLILTKLEEASMWANQIECEKDDTLILPKISNNLLNIKDRIPRI